MLNNQVSDRKLRSIIDCPFFLCLVARHRREIKQLLDSARDRSRATSSVLSNVSQAGQNSTTPPETSPTIDEIQKTPETTSQPTKPTTGKHCFNNLQCLLKIFLITSFLVAGSTLFVQNFDRLFPAQKGSTNVDQQRKT